MEQYKQKPTKEASWTQNRQHQEQIPKASKISSSSTQHKALPEHAKNAPNSFTPNSYNQRKASQQNN